MNRKEYSALVVTFCVLTIVLTSFHFIYTVDAIASVFGYFFSFVVGPMLLVAIPIGVLTIAIPAKFSLKQKWGLFIAPVGCNLVLIGSTYWALQYGTH